VICRSLLSDSVEQARLFFLDGRKGLREAILGTSGWRGLIQRSKVHKLRNVDEHLPWDLQGWVRPAVRQTWRASS